MKMNPKILWADDEIELLKPHVLFLEAKGYEVVTVNNGREAVDKVKNGPFDLVFLDENMPGISGLEALQQIKAHNPNLPVVMITKSEEEHIMEGAIGSKIADYLIKPVNPNQILLSIKKNLDEKRLISEKTTQDYRQEFREISMQLGSRMNAEEWREFYKKMVYWTMELSQTHEESMKELLVSQKLDANDQFVKYYADRYLDWINGKVEAPVMSHTVFNKKVKPLIQAGQPLYWVVIDNLRYDQWKVIAPFLKDLFRWDAEDIIYSILPTATMYARNAMFSGLLPTEMQKLHPQWWREEDEEGSKNDFEYDFLQAQLKRAGMNIKTSYHKVVQHQFGKRLVDQMSNLKENDLNVIVYNFVDMLSHARSEMEVIKELAEDEPAYLSLTKSWFEHSPLKEMLEKMAEQKARVIISTDHGTVRVEDPIKVIGDKATNTNLRYKVGKNLNYNTKEVFEVKDAAQAHLPRPQLSSTYIFAKSKGYFVYQNNYHQFVAHYKNTFQHGGVSMEEVLIPFVVLQPK
jgi:CheY-like chemotaxis protein